MIGLKNNDNKAPYRAVSIVPGIIDCCDAAREKSTERYLCNEAPLLPLPECTNQGTCKCKYKHWDDRRQEDRRAFDNGIASQYFSGTERRKNDDRRAG
jgi:hypothetical protein